MAGFTVSGCIRPSDNTSGIQIVGSGDTPSTKVKVSISVNNNVATYAFQAMYGSAPPAFNVDIGSNGSPVSTFQFVPQSLPLFFYPQFKNPASDGSPSSFTGYNESQTVLRQPAQMQADSTSYPDANITMTIVDAGS